MKIRINKIYTFLGIKKYNHKFKNLCQYSINGLNYNDDIVGDNLHLIKTNKIFKKKRNIKNILPNSIIKKYGSSQLNVWSNNEK